jgi:hypothetical protein
MKFAGGLAGDAYGFYFRWSPKYRAMDYMRVQMNEGTDLGAAILWRVRMEAKPE